LLIGFGDVANIGGGVVLNKGGIGIMRRNPRLWSDPSGDSSTAIYLFPHDTPLFSK
jgi:hypothetical protein